jgi:hypothetical protein
MEEAENRLIASLFYRTSADTVRKRNSISLSLLSFEGDQYQPLMWRFYTSHRRALFQLVRSLPMHAATQDQSLMDALAYVLAQENRRSLYLDDALDLSFASEAWQRLVVVKRTKRTRLARQHLEVCVFSAVAAELKAGDLYVEGSERFADYRAQLLPWETCDPMVAEYCQEIGLPADAPSFVKQLREQRRSFF